MTDRLNIVLVVVDTARRDRFGCYGYHRGTTAAVDAFAREALVFDRMITPAPWTVPSHASLFTGLYPREHGAHHPVPILRHNLTLAAHLKASGYATLSITNNRLIHPETGLAEGFAENVISPGRAGNRWIWQAKYVLGLRDSGAAATNRVVASLLGRLRRPFFLFINYLECHWNYTPPRRLERRFARGYSWTSSVRRRLRHRKQNMWEAIVTADPATIALYNDLYDAELACLDEQFEHLLDLFQRTRLLDETIFILTSDHGDNIGEQGLASHQGSLRQNLVHVPFLARIPGRSAGRVGGLAQFTDIYSGLCELVDLPIPAHLRDRLFSINPFCLSATDAGRAFAYAEWHHWGPQKIAILEKKAPHFDFSRIPLGLEAVQDQRYKLVVDLGTGQEVLHDLEMDAQEKEDVARLYPAELNRLRTGLMQWRSAHSRQNPSTYTNEEQAAVDRRLQELGYV